MEIQAISGNTQKHKYIFNVSIMIYFRLLKISNRIWKKKKKATENADSKFKCK